MELEELVVIVQTKERENSENSAEWQELYCRLQGLVYKHAHKPHLASLHEEAVSEAWLAVVKAVHSYDAAAGVHFAGYVEAMVKYAVWNLFKRERRRWEREISDGDFPDWLAVFAAADDVAAACEEQWQQKELYRLLLTLPVKQRLAVVRTICTGEKLTAVAVTMGITPQAVQNLRRRGLAGLKKALAGMYSSEGR